MKNSPLFRYSLSYKVFNLVGITLLIFVIVAALLLRFTEADPIFILSILGIVIGIYIISLGLFLKYVSYPLEKVAEQILALLTGKIFQKVSPERNDEIGVISHFFNTVTERITDLSDDIESGKRMSSELELAAKIQNDILPKVSPENIVGLDIVAASKASSEVGGDCFDFINKDDETLIYIGDVTGHGVPAGLVMMLVSASIRILASEKLGSKEIIAKTNKVLKEKISSNHFMSLVMLNWNNISQKMSFIGAGHEYILHYSATNKVVKRIKSGGIALKMIPDINKLLKSQDIDFKDGDVILLYTDGITEARNHQGQMYEIERLENSLLKNAHRQAADMFEHITDEFASFLGKKHHQEDDITMIVIKNIGQHEKSRKVQLSLSKSYQEKDTEDLWSWN